MSTGLKIDDIPISSLSGPMSFYYLKPDENVFMEYKLKGLELPLIVLLGDVHRINTGCNPCIPPSCQNIASRSFLMRLDQLAKNHPVDFYTESSPSLFGGYFEKASQDNSSLLFGIFLSNIVKECHDPKLRGKIRSSSRRIMSGCPTDYVRWHFADLRHMTELLEGYLFIPITNYLNFQISSERVNKVLTTYSYYTKAGKDLGYITDIELSGITRPFLGRYFSLFSSFFSVSTEEDYDLYMHIYDYFKTANYGVCKSNIPKSTPLYISAKKYTDDNGLSDYVDNIFSISFDILRFNSSHKRTGLNKDKGLEYFLMIIEVISSLFKFVIMFVDNIFEFISYEGIRERRKSGIYKQLDKQVVNELKDINFWKKLFVDIVLSRHNFITSIYNIYFINTFYNVIPVYDLLEKLIMSDQIETFFIDHLDDDKIVRKTVYVDNIKNITNTIIEELYELSISLGSPLLDIYTIMRMFKKPGEGLMTSSFKGIQPSLSIGYFGQKHVEGIMSVLTKNFGYKLDYSYNTNIVNLYNIEHNINSDIDACILFNEDVNIKEDLDQHHLLRS